MLSLVRLIIGAVTICLVSCSVLSYHEIGLRSVFRSRRSIEKRQAPLLTGQPVTAPSTATSATTALLVDDGLSLYNETDEWKNASEVVTHKDEKYYDVFTYHDDEYFNVLWEDVDQLVESKKAVGTSMHPQLKNSYRRAVATQLNFTFPFYGFPTHNVTIATGGFLYSGEHTHSWLAATQYIAPLMANFDTTTMEEATIAYADTKEKFIVEWRNVVVRKQEESGNFTFQCQLHKNGSIYFLYKEVPIKVDDISDVHHPRKVGLSDAFMETENVDKALFSKRIIYEYHRIEIPLSDVTSMTSICIQPKQTCFSFTTCESCLSAKLEHFQCTWCSSAEDQSGDVLKPFCSDKEGNHRLREDFKKSRCANQTDSLYCQSAPSPVLPVASTTRLPDKSTTTPSTSSSSADSSADELVNKEEVVTGGGGGGGYVVLAVFIAMILATSAWVLYAYYNPHTTSGQLLIRYRPARWGFGGSDVRYTASVHM